MGQQSLVNIILDVKVPDSCITYTLGLRHVFSRSSLNTLDTFKQILDDIDNVQLALGRGAVSSKIVAKIKNTMSDRRSAEKQDFRAEILPTVIENWGEMTDIVREQMTPFFVGSTT